MKNVCRKNPTHVGLPAGLIFNADGGHARARKKVQNGAAGAEKLKKNGATGAENFEK